MGDLIPTFTLGIPGSTATAILMVTLVVHGVAPGPQFMTSGVTPYAVFSGILLTQTCLLVTGASVAKYFRHMALIPNSILAPLIITLSFLGSYTEKYTTFYVGLMLVFGILGWVSNQIRYPVVPMLLGVLLGPLVELNFHRSLGIGLGSYSIFLTRPITSSILLLTICFFLWPYVSPMFSRKRRIQKLSVAQNPGDNATAGSIMEVITLVAALVFFGLIFWLSSRYSSGTALFPRIVAVVGLGFGMYRIWVITKAKQGLSRSRRSSEDICVQPWVSIVALWIYLLIFYTLGLGIGTVAYVSGMAWVAGYRRLSILIPLSLGFAFAVCTLAWILNIPLMDLKTLGFL